MPKDPFAKMLAGEMEPDYDSEPVRMSTPRTLRVKVSEIPNGQMIMPGHPISLRVSGTAKMIDDEGDVLVNVTRVEGYQEQPQKKEAPEVVYKPTEMPSPS